MFMSGRPSTHQFTNSEFTNSPIQNSPIHQFRIHRFTDSPISICSLGHVNSRRSVLLLSLAATAAVVLSFRGIYEPDLWWHLAQGREAAAGRLVHSNLFNFLYSGYPQPYTP